jgi:hypothetical protein
MKNVQILFMVIITIIVSGLAYVIMFEQKDLSEQKNENKLWVVAVRTHCNDPWDQDEKTINVELNTRIHLYYASHDVEVYDIVRITDPEQGEHCEGCSCSNGDNLFLLVNELDVARMLNSGFIIAEENATKKTVSNTNKPKPMD